MEQYYHPELPNEGYIQLRDDEERHLLKVRRARIGDHFRCTDGNGRMAHVKFAGRDARGNLYAIEKIDIITPPNPRIHLAVALPRQESRMEWLLEKSVELGVDEITPLITERGIRERKVFTVAFHHRLLQIGRKTTQTLVVGQNRFRCTSQKIGIPNPK